MLIWFDLSNNIHKDTKTSLCVLNTTIGDVYYRQARFENVVQNGYTYTKEIMVVYMV